MRPTSNRELLKNGLVVVVAFTAFYGLIRLVNGEDWRWDHLAQSCVGLLIGFCIVWVINSDTRADASPPTSDREQAGP